MSRLLLSWPVLALVLAAADSVLVRLAFPWREEGVVLFAEAFALWLALGLLALVPARLCQRFLERRESEDAARRARARAPVLLLGWMALPIAIHATIDRHLGLRGNIGELKQPEPWIELLAVVGTAVCLLWLLGVVLRRLAPWRMAAGAGLVAAVVGACLPLHHAASGLAGPGAGRPNLLLMVWDTCRADRLEPYGYARPTTPNLERLAEESIVFENAVSASCFTLTSHFSLLTGVYPSTHGARLMRSRFDGRRTELVSELLRKSGYRTAAFVGTDVLAGRTGIRRGFEVYDDAVDPPVCSTYAWRLVHDVQAFVAMKVPGLRQNGLPHWIQDFQRPASEVLEHALAWIRSDDPRPWFCLVNLYDVHWPYLPRGVGLDLVGPYDGPVDGYLFRSNRWRPGYEMTDADRHHVAELYEGEIRELDHDVDAFLRALELERGGTAVIMTADHGEALGEAGRWKHEDITEPQVRVPLMIRLPEPRPEGRRVAFPASGVDVGPTLLGLAGLGPRDGFEGVDLLGDEMGPDRLVRVEDRDHIDPWDVRVALYRGHWKLVRWGLGKDERYELYDLSTDPVGVHDVSKENPRVFQDLVLLMAKERERGDAADGLVGREDPSQADALRALGYGGD